MSFNEPELNQAAPRRVLAVFAHPDDAEIWAGGTLLAHAAAGDQVAVCVLTHGNDHRTAEAEAGARALQARLYQLDLHDRAVTADRSSIAEVAGVIAQERPGILITHWEDDTHPDHHAAAQITRAALLLSEAEQDLEAFFWSDTYNGIGSSGLFNPQCLVDISAFFKEKCAAISAHQSQGVAHYLAMAARQNAGHGARAGITFAEGFIRVPLFGRSQHSAPSLWSFA